MSEPARYRLQMAGEVCHPGPEGMLHAARVGLSAEGYARLMQTTGGAAPTAQQLVREVEFEREGRYPDSPDLAQPVLARAAQDGFMYGLARAQLSADGFRKLMLEIDLRPPTARELCAAVEAERAAAQHAS